MTTPLRQERTGSRLQADSPSRWTNAGLGLIDWHHPTDSFRDLCRAYPGRRLGADRRVAGEESAAAGHTAWSFRGSQVRRRRPVAQRGVGCGDRTSRRGWRCRRSECPRRASRPAVGDLDTGAQLLRIERAAASCGPSSPASPLCSHPACQREELVLASAALVLRVEEIRGELILLTISPFSDRRG
jgi:hypothetical protein